MNMFFDPECLKLAEYFLDQGAVNEQYALAQHIQEAVEDWLRGYEEDLARDAEREPDARDTP